MLQRVAVRRWKLPATRVSSLQMNCRMVVAVDDVVMVAVLLVLAHVSLDGGGSALRFIDTPLESSGVARRIARLHW